jgi:hypothetical protein
VFRLSDGLNVRGPATAPQPAFDTRMVDGHLEVRLRRHDQEDDGSPHDVHTDGEEKRTEGEAADGNGD